jgi:hypothetical protein
MSLGINVPLFAMSSIGVEEFQVLGIRKLAYMWLD